MKTPGGEKLETATVRWCPQCSGEKQLEKACQHQGARLIECPTPGTIIAGSYEFVSVLGAGGMGVVYKCHSIHLKKFVAIKMMLAQSIAPEQAIRFQQEARAAAKFNHANLISVSDFGITDSGEPFMVMEYLEGRSLADFLKSGELRLPQLLRILRQCCAGLAYAHRHGVLHRDLKPANIMIFDAGDELHAKILDFGIAKIADSGQMALTSTGSIFGTPPYMSPEQTRGDELDPGSDVYSMGCVLYEALTGKRALVGENALETYHLKQTQVPVPLRQIAPSKMYPESLEKLVAAMLATNPADRPSMDSITWEIDQILEALEKEKVEEEVSQEGVEKTARSDKSSVRAGLLIGVLTLVIAIAYGASVNRGNRFQSSVKLTPSHDKAEADEIYTYAFNRELQREGERKDFRKLSKIQAQNLFEDGSRLVIRDYDGVTREALHKLFNHQLISRVNLIHTDINDDAMKEMTENFKGLRSVRIEKCSDLTEKGFLYLAACKSITKLDLLRCNVTMDAVKAFASMPGLKHLVLYDITIDNGCLRALSVSPSIERLEIKKIELRNADLVFLANFRKLKSVSLQSSSITDLGIASLSKLPLEEINLAECESITDKAVLELAYHRQSTVPLLDLNLEETGITKESIDALGSIKSLKTLRLEGCPNLTNEHISWLRVLLPQTEIKFKSAETGPNKQNTLLLE